MRYKLNGKIELPAHNITVNEPEFELDFAGFSGRRDMVQIDVIFFVTVQGEAKELVRTFSPPLNPESLNLTVAEASINAMLNLEEIATPGYTPA